MVFVSFISEVKLAPLHTTVKDASIVEEEL